MHSMNLASLVDDNQRWESDDLEIFPHSAPHLKHVVRDFQPVNNVLSVLFLCVNAHPKNSHRLILEVSCDLDHLRHCLDAIGTTAVPEVENYHLAAIICQ